MSHLGFPAASLNRKRAKEMVTGRRHRFLGLELARLQMDF
jgi:hypothetical protein